VLQALAELKSTKDEAVYVGDSEVDMQTASNSGLPCITVLWGFRDKEYLTEQGATVFANTPKEVFDLLVRDKD
jgi:phosphoglycolate phosphatase